MRGVPLAKLDFYDKPPKVTRYLEEFHSFESDLKYGFRAYGTHSDSTCSCTCLAQYKLPWYLRSLMS